MTKPDDNLQKILKQNFLKKFIIIYSNMIDIQK